MSDFDAFKNSFKGDLVSPSDPDYLNALTRWAINSSRNAEIVAFVRDAEDVSRAILYAKRAGLPLAIRGGGHNPSGASSCEGGLVIDLSRYINGARIDAENKLAYVGGGALWKTVDEAAIKHGLATVGGTVNHTGVAGLTLGGGYGWLSAAHGLAVDNLVQGTIVTADGSILTANASENSDLFWGIRGGGSNFGVCTEFVLKLHPQRRKVFAGTLVFTPDVLTKFSSVAESWWTAGPSDKEGMIHIFTRGPDGQPCIVAVVFYNGPESEGREVYKAFLDLKPVMDTCREIPYEELNSLQNSFAEPGRNVYMKGTLQPPVFPREISLTAFERVVALSASGEFTLAFMMEFFPLHKINAVPDNATAFRRGSPPNVLVVASWQDDSPEKTKHAREAAHELTALMGGMGYGNYSPESDVMPREPGAVVEKAKALFGNNYARLQAVKKRYDPQVVFNRWFAIAPAAA